MDTIASRIEALEARVSLSPAARALHGDATAGAGISANGILKQIASTKGAGSPSAAGSAGEAPGAFTQALHQALQSVDNTMAQADQIETRFQLGNPQVSLEQTVLAGQKASLSFQAAVQVRNRFVQAYTEIMSMNV